MPCGRQRPCLFRPVVPRGELEVLRYCISVLTATVHNRRLTLLSPSYYNSYGWGRQFSVLAFQRTITHLGRPGTVDSDSDWVAGGEAVLQEVGI